MHDKFHERKPKKFKVNPSKKAQERYNEFANDAMADANEALKRIDSLYEVKEITDENGDVANTAEFNAHKAEQDIGYIRDVIRKLKANNVLNITRAQQAEDREGLAWARVEALEEGDRLTKKDKKYPYVLAFKDTINRYKKNEAREQVGLEIGDFGLLFLLIPCIERDTNILINRNTGFSFKSAKEIAEYFGASERNTQTKIKHLLDAGILYRPPELNQSFAVEETLVRCGVDDSESYKIKHSRSINGERKTKKENLEQETSSLQDKKTSGNIDIKNEVSKTMQSHRASEPVDTDEPPF